MILEKNVVVFNCVGWEWTKKLIKDCQSKNVEEKFEYEEKNIYCNILSSHLDKFKKNYSMGW